MSLRLSRREGGLRAQESRRKGSWETMVRLWRMVDGAPARTFCGKVMKVTYGRSSPDMLRSMRQSSHYQGSPRA